jgi:hypothetical protein
MKRVLYVALIALAVGAVGLFLRPEHRMVHSSWPSVKSLTELSQKADLVIVGRVARVNRTMQLEPGEDAPIYTVFDVEVTETLKGPATPGQTVQVIQFGGRLGRVVEEAIESPLAKVGQTYVMYTVRDIKTQDGYLYTVIAGSQGRFEAGADGKVRPVTRSHIEKEVEGKTIHDLLQLMPNG